MKTTPEQLLSAVQAATTAHMDQLHEVMNRVGATVDQSWLNELWNRLDDLLDTCNNIQLKKGRKA